MMNYPLWFVLFIPALLIEDFCWLTNPIACLFTRQDKRYDYVKRFKVHALLDRDYLRQPFYLWQTHDNAVDEGWYGLYEIPFLKDKTQSDYNSSWLIRYWCRLWWLSRNTAYGWHYVLFSKPKDLVPIAVHEYGKEGFGLWLCLTRHEHSFQFEAHIPLGFGKYNSINIGWKSHKQMPRRLYANRLIGIRSY
jgi:hypothetical protein